MAINLGNHGSGGEDFGELSDPAIVAEINITPLTDVFLVLLIIFMVTSSVLTQMGVDVQLPQSNHAASTDQTPGVIVTVESSGKILVNGTSVSLDDIGKAMALGLSQSKSKTIVLEGDRRAVLGTIVKIMDEGKKIGADKFAIATKPQ